MKRLVQCIFISLVLAVAAGCAPRSSLVKVSEVSAVGTEGIDSSVRVTIDAVDEAALAKDKLGVMTELLPVSMRDILAGNAADTYSIEHSISAGGRQVRSYELTMYGTDVDAVKAAAGLASLTVSADAAAGSVVMSASQTMDTDVYSQLIDGGFPADYAVPASVTQSPGSRSAYIASLEKLLVYAREWALDAAEYDALVEFYNSLFASGFSDVGIDSGDTYMRYTGVRGGVKLTVNVSVQDGGCTLSIDAAV